MYLYSKKVTSITRMVESAAAETKLEALDAILKEGQKFVVSYGSTYYYRVTDGRKKFSELPKITSGGPGDPVDTEGIEDGAVTEAKLDPTFVAGLVAAGDAVADISTTDATDEASAVTLVNECKAKINAILASLRGGGSLEE